VRHAVELLPDIEVERVDAAIAVEIGAVVGMARLAIVGTPDVVIGSTTQSPLPSPL
jgi:hypothetical protein